MRGEGSGERSKMGCSVPNYTIEYTVDGEGRKVPILGMGQRGETTKELGGGEKGRAEKMHSLLPSWLVVTKGTVANGGPNQLVKGGKTEKTWDRKNTRGYCGGSTTNTWAWGGLDWGQER